MRRKNNQRTKFKISLFILLIVTFGIGYALLTQKLTIGGNLEYGTMKWNVGFKSATDGGGTISSNPEISTDKKTITITCDLGASTNSETCIATAVIENNSTFAVQLEKDPTLTYDDTYVKAINAVWIKDSKVISASNIINAEEIREMKIIVTTKELSPEILPKDGLSVPITVTMNWVEAKEGADELTILLTNDDFIAGCYYNSGTLKTTGSFAKIKTIESFIAPQKIRIVIEDSANDVSTQKYKVVYSAYDDTGKILNPNDSANALFNFQNGEIELDLVGLYPTGSKFKVDIMLYDGTTFFEIPSTAKITVYAVEEIEETPKASVFANKKIDILGDSITSQAKYIPTLQTLTEASSIINHGISSQKITDFATRVNNLDTSADLIIVFGGTNDYWHHTTEIGTINDDTNETFYGALNVIYNTLITNYPNAEYLFMSPPKQTYSGKDETYDWGYGTLDDFRTAMETFATSKGIKYYDLSSEAEWDPAVHTSDGVHPNADGGVLLANLIYEFLQNNF